MASHSDTQGNAFVRSRIARALWHLTGRARTARAILPKPVTILECQNGSSHSDLASYYN